MWKRILVLVAAVAVIGPRAVPRFASAGDAATGNYNAAELNELVGPVALYPDVVIAAMLPATTFPADITAAAGVLAKNGGSVSEVPDGVTWDKSVQSLLQYPDVLVWLKDNPDWVAQMGFAVANQQSEVLAAIQQFRSDAKTAGNLNSDSHQIVTTADADDGGGAEVIVIQPADPTVVYVPTYSPVAVVQPGYAWSWGVGFAMGVTGVWAYNNLRWGSNGGDINISNNNNVNINTGNINTGNINRGNVNTGNINTGNVNRGNVNAGNNVGPDRPSKWNASNKPSQRPGGAVARPKEGNWGTGSGTRPGSGVKPRPPGGGAGARPTPPATRPAAGGARPSAPPSVPGSRPAPAARPAPASRPSSGFGGASSGPSTRASSDRGASSLNRSGGGASGGGQSRGQSGRTSGGGSRGGGGGGRGGGRR